MLSRCLRSSVPLIVLVALVALPMLLPATAHAGDGKRWPGRTITYYDATRDKDSVRKAVLAWNRTGARIAFRRTFNRRAANIVIRNSRKVPRGCGTGLATLGYLGRGRQGYVNILHGTARDGQGCAWPGQTFVVAHELGHVLGLDHDDRACAVMNSSHTGGIAASRCLGDPTSFAHAAQWRCRLIEPRDVRRVVRMYGGRARAVRTNPWCDLVEPPKAPTTATATLVPDSQTASQHISLTVRRPADPVTPPFLRAALQDGGIEVYVGPACQTKRPTPGGGVNPDIYTTGRWQVAPDTDETRLTDTPGPGSWCYSIWLIDGFGRASATPATSLVEVPAPTTPTPPPAMEAAPAPQGAARARSGAKASSAPRTYSLHGDAR